MKGEEQMKTDAIKAELTWIKPNSSFQSSDPVQLPLCQGFISFWVNDTDEEIYAECISKTV